MTALDWLEWVEAHPGLASWIQGGGSLLAVIVAICGVWLSHHLSMRAQVAAEWRQELSAARQVVQVLRRCKTLLRPLSNSICQEPVLTAPFCKGIFQAYHGSLSRSNSLLENLLLSNRLNDSLFGQACMGSACMSLAIGLISGWEGRSTSYSEENREAIIEGFAKIAVNIEDVLTTAEGLLSKGDKGAFRCRLRAVSQKLASRFKRKGDLPASNGSVLEEAEGS